jgi:hypothetical protein
MPFLPGLAVVFAGILGGKDSGVDRQVKTIVHDLHVKPIAMAAGSLRTLTHHGGGTREIVKKLHAEGVVAFEVVTGHGEPTLRLVVYDADGGLKTYSEVSLGAHGLSPDDLDVLRTNLADDVTSLGGGAAEPAPAPAPLPAPPPPPKAVKPMPAAQPKPAPAKPAPAAEPEIELDAPASAPAHGEAAAKHDDSAAKPAAPSDGDAVSADEIAAMTAGSSAATAEGSSSSGASALHLGAALGFGVSSRYFTPSPSTVAAFTSSPVGAMQLEAHVQPTAHTSLSVSTDRTLGMTTPMRDGTVAATTISRWEAAGTYAMIRSGSLEIGPRVGAGRRSFALDSMDPSRSPDGEYDYLMLGMAGAMHLGPHLTVRAAALFEPVVSGTEPTEMAFGEATRWAVDVGGAVEYRPFDHVFARVAADYQRFTWSWDQAGARGAGGAVDEYPSGTISLGADY